MTMFSQLSETSKCLITQAISPQSHSNMIVHRSWKVAILPRDDGMPTLQGYKLKNANVDMQNMPPHEPGWEHKVTANT